MNFPFFEECAASLYEIMKNLKCVKRVDHLADQQMPREKNNEFKDVI
jgi:hypothetical protein